MNYVFIFLTILISLYIGLLVGKLLTLWQLGEKDTYNSNNQSQKSDKGKVR